MPSIFPNYSDVLGELKTASSSRVDEAVAGKFACRHTALGYSGSYPPSAEDKIDQLDREAIATGMLSAYSSASLTHVEGRSLDMQSDILGSLEKAYRALHTGRVSLLARSCSLYSGHVADNGYLASHLASVPIKGG